MNRRSFLKLFGLSAIVGAVALKSSPSLARGFGGKTSVRYAHTCGEVVAEHAGGPMRSGDLLLAKDWIVLGKQMTAGSPVSFVCPRCNERFAIRSQFLRLADGSSEVTA